MHIDDMRGAFWRSVEWAYYLFFATFPFIVYNGFLYGPSSTRSLNLIIFSAIIGIACAVWSVSARGKGIHTAMAPALGALLIYLGSLVLSGLLGENWGTTFWSVSTRMTGAWYLLSLGVFMLPLWGLLEREQVRRRLVLVVTVSTALYSVLYLFSARGLGLIFPSYSLDAFTFGNSTFAGMYLFGAFLLALYYLASAPKRMWWMYLLPVLLVVNPAFLNVQILRGDFSGQIIGAARASTLALGLSLVFIFGIWVMSKIRQREVRAKAAWGLFAFGVCVAGAASLSLLSPNGYVRELYLSQGTQARPLVWEISEKAISQRPAFGWGADNFERVFEKNFDSRLLQKDNGNEAWFDRAHNVYIDQMLDNGRVGLVLYLLVYLLVAVGLLYALLNTTSRGDRYLAGVLIVYFPLHLAELQTAFDTSISYPMLALVFVLAGVVTQKAWQDKNPGVATVAVPPAAVYAAAGTLSVFLVWSLLVGVVPFTKAQIANEAIRTVGSAERRLPLYPDLFNSPLDKQTFLWRTVVDFQRGIAEKPSVLSDQTKVVALAQEAELYTAEYRAYVQANPTNFRAHLGLADILMYQAILGKEDFVEARAVLDKAVALVPQHPAPYWMKAVSYVYEGKFAEARAVATDGLDLNPGVETSQHILKYVEQSKKDFPEISMYFFRQI